MKKLFLVLFIGAIFASVYTPVFAMRTWYGPVVDGMRTTCLETSRSDGDISASRFRSVTNLSWTTCENLSRKFYSNVVEGNYVYMYVQYFYNTTVDSVLNFKYGDNGILLSNNGARSLKMCLETE